VRLTFVFRPTPLTFIEFRETSIELEDDPVFAAASAAAVESAPVNEHMQTFVFSATLSKELQTNLSRRSGRKGSNTQKSSTLGLSTWTGVSNTTCR
jgi:hypothetical protein